MKKKFGQIVREKREEMNLTQKQLSVSAGVNCNYIGMVERGEINITIESMEKIANGLHAVLIISLVNK